MTVLAQLESTGIPPTGRAVARPPGAHLQAALQSPRRAAHTGNAQRGQQRPRVRSALAWRSTCAVRPCPMKTSSPAIPVTSERAEPTNRPGHRACHRLGCKHRLSWLRRERAPRGHRAERLVEYRQVRAGAPLLPAERAPRHFDYGGTFDVRFARPTPSRYPRDSRLCLDDALDRYRSNVRIIELTSSAQVDGGSQRRPRSGEQRRTTCSLPGCPSAVRTRERRSTFPPRATRQPRLASLDSHRACPSAIVGQCR